MTLEKTLREAVQNDRVIHTILSNLAQRARSPWKGVTTVEQVQEFQPSDGQPVSRSEIVDAMRRLQECGAGQFLVGRRNQRSRLEWAMENPHEFARKVVQGSKLSSANGTVVSDLNESERSQRNAENQQEHSFWVREGCKLVLNLPADLSKAEAERIAAFVKALPFANDGE